MRISLSACGLIVLLISRSAWAAAPTPEFDYFASAADRVRARFERIEVEIARLRAAGMSAEADAMRGELQYFRGRLAGTTARASNDPALDIVGVFEGPLGSQPPSKPTTGEVHVQVNPTGHPVVLALTSAWPVDWKLNVHPEATMHRVIVYSNSHLSRSTVANVPAGVAVEQFDVYSGGSYAYEKNFGPFPRTARWLHGLTGLTVSSIQGDYFVQAEPYSIGGDNTDWRVQRVLTEVQPLYEQAVAHELNDARAAAEQLRFTALLRTPRQGSPPITELREFSGTGVTDGTRLLLDLPLQYVAVDEEHGRFFGLYRDRAYEIDPANGALTALPAPSSDVPYLGWATALTYDSKRNRLVMTAFGGPGALYSYSVDDGRWSVLADLRNIDLGALTYVEPLDAFFALSDRPQEQLLRFDASGQLKEKLSLSRWIPQASPLEPFQLFAVGEKLGLLTTPYADLDYPHLPPEMRFYLIEPETGDVIYSGIVAIPEPTGAVALIGCAACLLRRRSVAA